MKRTSLIALFVILVSELHAQVTLDAPAAVPGYGIAEFVFHVENPPFENPFTEVDIRGTFNSGTAVSKVYGFADSQDGSVFRLRFSPEPSVKNYTWEISFRSGNLDQNFTGILMLTPPVDRGPVIADKRYPKHFIYAGSGEPFFHMGYTAYGLVDPANDDAQVESTIRYCRENGFNKIRFILSGYPRDFDNRTSDDVDHGVPEDPWKSPNYGSLPGRVNPLPTWTGEPHKYDFTRFNVAFWQRVDRAVKLMKENDIIATCIFIIEKQNLPGEIGTLTENEYRLYKYGVARLAAYSNVWWDLGNEHNEFRKPDWGNTMGNFVKENDPYDRPASAHAYAEFFYNDSPWADFIITQQYGDPDSVHDWTLKYKDVKKPYVNEEYGYEGDTDKPVGHGMNSGWVRRCHWAIAMAGGYATYGDWSKGTSYFYMGIPGPGKAATQMNHLKKFFEAVPFRRMIPADDLISNGYCLALAPDLYIFYLHAGGSAEINLERSGKERMHAEWYDPRTGEWGDNFVLKRGKNSITAPDANDWVLLVK